MAWLGELWRRLGVLLRRTQLDRDLKEEMRLHLDLKTQRLIEAGVDVPADDDLPAALDERDALKRSIGKMGLLALEPLQVTSDRDRWHRRLLRQGIGVRR